MAKGQKRGNREDKKPKAVKPKSIAAAPAGLSKGTTAPAPTTPKKR
jgi:hypothetical protein